MLTELPLQQGDEYQYNEITATSPQEQKNIKNDTIPRILSKTPVEDTTTMQKPIAGFTNEQLGLVKRTVAKNATDDELSMFMHIAKKAGLDPFLKEIWFVKYKDGSTYIMAGRDGFLSIAQKSGEFRGIQSAAIYEKDKFNIDYSDPENIKINHTTNPYENGNKIIGAWARSKRKNCIDAVVIVMWKDYVKNYAGTQSFWEKYPVAMITKVAESISLKKHYGIAGIVSKEEMGYEDEKNNTDNLIDSDKLFEDTKTLINKIIKKEDKEKAINNAIKSGQFNKDQINELKNLNI